VSYVEDPLFLLREIKRILRPKGRLVLSTLQQDADISRIYWDGVGELQRGFLGGGVASSAVTLDRSARSFLNDAARLLDLEEEGTFHFWSANELAALIGDAGFERIVLHRAFGDPPQAFLVAAERP
jgi:SAM-dependent methyltransferase